MILFTRFRTRTAKAGVVLAGLILTFSLYAQTDTVRHLYRPQSNQVQTSSIQTDTLEVPSQAQLDSIAARQRYIQDSILAREVFVRDSIHAREVFVRDSIQRRQKILDSLNFLKMHLPHLIEASLKTIENDFFLYRFPLTIVGDSTLSNFKCKKLPFNLNAPYTPWETTINLSDDPVKVEVDTIAQKVTSIQGPIFKCFFVYGSNPRILRINEQGAFLSNRYGKFYKSPFDSVFFDAQGRITKIKRYINFYQATDNYRRGALLFTHLNEVKQYDYDSHNNMTAHQLVHFCERWSKQTPSKVCFIEKYTLEKEGNSFRVTRQNDPVNKYSDGVFVYDFDALQKLKSVSFNNSGNTENWKTMIEVNELNYVTNYFYQSNGKISKSLMINYYLDDPSAKHKVETISCTFEDDGVSYYQQNNTTKKVRVRDKLTMEWGPWK